MANYVVNINDANDSPHGTLNDFFIHGSKVEFNMDSAVIETDYLFLTDKLEKKVTGCLLKAEQQFRQSFDYQSIEINIRGRAAGQIKYTYSSKAYFKNLNDHQNLPVLRFNPYLLAKYKETFIDQVVPHECAHLVAYALFGMKIKPHGSEWKAIMVNLYQQSPDVTHRFEIARKAIRLFDYGCGCLDINHQLTVIRHNKIVKQKAVYLCKNCRSPLIYK
ncbi:MAG: SprT protein [Pseudohongiellaceae bacterium]|jgi:SprT protein